MLDFLQFTVIAVSPAIALVFVLSDGIDTVLDACEKKYKNIVHKPKHLAD